MRHEGFRITEKNDIELQKRVKKKGDKSKIINGALEKWFLPNKIC